MFWLAAACRRRPLCMHRACRRSAPLPPTAATVSSGCWLQSHHAARCAPHPVPSRSNLFEWAVTVLGPPDTLYEGGFFNAVLKFPKDYPQSPPDMRFTSEMW